MASLLLKFIFWILCGVVVVLSLLPADQLPPATLDVWDKAQHALGFALLTTAGLMAYPRPSARLAGGLLLLGAGIELAQSLTTWRQGDGWDWLADAIGIAIVMLIAHQCKRERQPVPTQHR
jgi:VanZ family protein